MNLPFILNVAIGLLFIYLILSLLASEVQELLATLLQWRAKHLKEAIETLLSGGSGAPEEESVRHLVTRLYDNTLMRNMNQDAKGWIAGSMRNLTRLFAWNRKGAFGTNQATGPSYIAPETFATSLVDSLGLPALSGKLTEFRLKKFAQRIIGPYSVQQGSENIDLPAGSIIIPAANALSPDENPGRIRQIAQQYELYNLNEDPAFQTLVYEFHDALEDFGLRQAALVTAVARMSEAFQEFIHASEQDKDPGFVNRLKAEHRSLFGEGNERALVAGKLRPNIYEISQLADDSSDVFQELKQAYASRLDIATKVDAIIQAKLAAYNRELTPPVKLDQVPLSQRQTWTNDALEQLIQSGQLTPEEGKIYQIYDGIRHLPQPLRESLSSLARRASVRAQETGDELNQFRNEIAVWFDRSMSRASGVYRRNAKGVAIALGLLLATFTNADSFYIVDRLTSDENLRNLVTEQAKRLVPESSSQQGLTTAQLEQLRDNADDALKELSVPVGWNATHIGQQFQCPTTSQAKTEFEQKCQALKTEFNLQRVLDVSLQNPLSAGRILLGWLLTGLAISMGAPFWFDLLGKLIKVRNTGSKPASPEALETEKSDQK